MENNDKENIATIAKQISNEQLIQIENERQLNKHIRSSSSF